jgi:hypothetical protein
LKFFELLLTRFSAEGRSFDSGRTPQVSGAQIEVAWAPISLKPPP